MTRKRSRASSYPRAAPETSSETSARAPRRHFALLLLASFFSGLAALVYELLWVRRLGEIFGNHVYAIQVVLAVFFTGLGLGAGLFGRRADRMDGGPGLFAALELTIAASGLAFLPACERLEAFYSAHAPLAETGWTLLAKGTLATALLFVPTLAMGGTLPALVRCAVRSRAFGRAVGVLYGANTLGAAAGVGLAMFLLIPALGLARTSWVAALLNAVAAASAWAAAGAGRTAADPRAPLPSTPVAERAPARFLAAAAASGFLSVGIELLFTRALASRFLSTLYSFATILLVFLLCLGLGALGLQLLERRRWLGPSVARVVLFAAGATGLASVWLLTRLPESPPAGGLAATQVGELFQALAVFALPTLFFGLNFPLLARLLNQRNQRGATDLGLVYLANTLGSVLAAIGVGFFLLPWLGLERALLALCWSAILLAQAVFPPPLPRFRGAVVLGELGLAVGLTLAARGEVALWRQSSGDRLLFQADLAPASVAVVQTSTGDRLLKVDNSYRLGTTRAALAQARQGLIPLLLAERCAATLVIGLGTGGSAGAVAAYGDQRTDVLEILPGLERLLPFFAEVNSDLAAILASPTSRVRLFETDARTFVRSATAQASSAYDVVIGDLFIPWRAGEGAMYTLEHFRAVRSALAPGGLFCQWLPLYQLAPRELRTIARTFCEAFPAVELLWLYWNVEQPAIGLVGSEEPLVLCRDSLRRRMEESTRAAVLARADLTDPGPFYGAWIAGRQRLLTWCQDAPLETRDRPRVEFGAAASLFDAGGNPARLNVPLLLELTQPLGAGSFAGDLDEDGTAEVERWQRAVSHFFRARWRHTFGSDRSGAVRELAQALVETPQWNFLALNLELLAAEAREAGDAQSAQEAERALRSRPH